MARGELIVYVPRPRHRVATTSLVYVDVFVYVYALSYEGIDTACNV